MNALAGKGSVKAVLVSIYISGLRMQCKSNPPRTEFLTSRVSILCNVAMANRKSI